MGLEDDEDEDNLDNIDSDEEQEANFEIKISTLSQIKPANRVNLLNMGVFSTKSNNITVTTNGNKTRYVAEIDINDIPQQARWKVTHKVRT